MKISTISLNIVILTLLLTTASLLPNISSAIESDKTFQNIITFGDSLTDTGNNNWVHSEGVIGTPITSSIDAAGDERFIWVNYVVNEINLKAGQQIYPSHLIGHSDLDIRPDRDNVNYAYASALTTDNYVDDSNAAIPYYPIRSDCKTPGQLDPDGTACVPGMLTQLNIYLDEVNHQVNHDSLFVIWGGGNDIFNVLAQLSINNGNEAPDPSDIVAQATTAAKQAVANILQMVATLTANGASEQQIVVFDLPNLADAPAGAGNEVLLSSISQGFNQGLQIQLMKAFPQVSLFSTDHILTDILNDPNNFNIDNTNGDCVAEGNNPECVGYLFFNAKHPTTQVHEIIAQSFEQTNHLVEQ